MLPEIESSAALNILCKQVNHENRLVVLGVRAKETSGSAVAGALPETGRGGIRSSGYLRREPATGTAIMRDVPPSLRATAGSIAEARYPGRASTSTRSASTSLRPQARNVPRENRKYARTAADWDTKDELRIFELTKIDDRMRQALVQQPQLDTLRKLARQAGNRTLQEEGILLVARGITSLTELQRVLKQ